MLVLAMIGTPSGRLRYTNASPRRLPTHRRTRQLVESTMLPVFEEETSFAEPNNETTNGCTNPRLVKRIDSRRPTRKASILPHSHASPRSRTLDAICKCKAPNISRAPAGVFLSSTHSPEPVKRCLVLWISYATKETGSCDSFHRCVMTRLGSTATLWKPEL